MDYTKIREYISQTKEAIAHLESIKQDGLRDSVQKEEPQAGIIENDTPEPVDEAPETASPEETPDQDPLEEFNNLIKVDPEDENQPGVQVIRQVMERIPLDLRNRIAESEFNSIEITMLYGQSRDITGVLLAAHYDPDNKSILIAYDHPISMVTTWALLHSIGEVVYDVLLTDDMRTEVAKAHGKKYDSLNPFEQQDAPGSPSGSKVFFSQALALGILDLEAAHAQYGDEVMAIVQDFIQDTGLPQEEAPQELPDEAPQT